MASPHDDVEYLLLHYVLRLVKYFARLKNRVLCF